MNCQCGDAYVVEVVLAFLPEPIRPFGVMAEA